MFFDRPPTDSSQRVKVVPFQGIALLTPKEHVPLSFEGATDSQIGDPNLSAIPMRYPSRCLVFRDLESQLLYKQKQSDYSKVAHFKQEIIKASPIQTTDNNNNNESKASPPSPSPVIIDGVQLKSLYSSYFIALEEYKSKYPEEDTADWFHFTWSNWTYNYLPFEISCVKFNLLALEMGNIVTQINTQVNNWITFNLDDMTQAINHMTDVDSKVKEEYHYHPIIGPTSPSFFHLPQHTQEFHVSMPIPAMPPVMDTRKFGEGLDFGPPSSGFAKDEIHRLIEVLKIRSVVMIASLKEISNDFLSLALNTFPDSQDAWCRRHTKIFDKTTCETLAQRCIFYATMLRHVLLVMVFQTENTPEIRQGIDHATGNLRPTTPLVQGTFMTSESLPNYYMVPLILLCHLKKVRESIAPRDLSGPIGSHINTLMILYAVRFMCHYHAAINIKKVHIMGVIYASLIEQLRRQMIEASQEPDIYNVNPKPPNFFSIGFAPNTACQQHPNTILWNHCTQALEALTKYNNQIIREPMPSFVTIEQVYTNIVEGLILDATCTQGFIVPPSWIISSDVSVPLQHQQQQQQQEEMDTDTSTTSLPLMDEVEKDELMRISIAMARFSLSKLVTTEDEDERVKMQCKEIWGTFLDCLDLSQKGYTPEQVITFLDSLMTTTH